MKVSSTNFKIDTAQTSIFIGLRGKPETLTTNQRVVCAMYSEQRMTTKACIMCNFRQEFGTCAECQPTSIVPAFEMSLQGVV